MSLFWIVTLVKRPGLPSTATSDTTTAVEVFTPFLMMQFFRVLLVNDVAPIEPKRITLGTVTLVFVSVRLLSVPPDVEPSIVKRLAPFVRISAAELMLPEMTLGAPFGFTVIVQGESKAFSAIAIPPGDGFSCSAPQRPVGPPSSPRPASTWNCGLSCSGTAEARSCQIPAGDRIRRRRAVEQP